MTIIKAFGALLFLVLSAACARGLYGPSLDTPVTAAPRELDELSARERAALLDRAQVWRPIDTARLDLLAGPPARDGFAFDAQVPCGFHYPSKPLTGATPKFECEVAPDDVVKVKYGEGNGEVFAEVAATRLFWALGFAADRMYPVKVMCLYCPANPHQASAAEWHLGKPGTVSTRVFDPAVIERKFGGESIETKGYEGWSWRELERAADNSVGAPRAHIDALKLLAAFVQHVDSKPDNQALVCVDARTRTDRQGNETCAQPMAMVKDLGSTFAAASKVSFPKMKLESWRSVDVWKNEKTCQANLTSSIVGTLEHPRVSEAGRRFLASRLSLLSDRQLTDLFTAARVDRRKDTVRGRQVTVADWVQAFKEKRAQIVDHRCQT
jgi:hypothetical protein